MRIVLGMLMMFLVTSAQANEIGTESLLLGDLRFVSGDLVATRPEKNELDVRIYLDEQGNPAEQLVTLSVGGQTEITNGESVLTFSDLSPNTEVDVEFDGSTMQVSYVFVYQST